MSKRMVQVVLLGAACLAAAGCKRIGGDGAQAEVQTASTVASAPSRLDDAGIAALVAQIHAAEVQGARQLGERLQTEEVRAFAAAMRGEHGEMADAVAGKGGGAPPQLATMRAAARGQTELLATLPAGDTHDRAYMAAQVLRHAQALDSLRRWQRVARAAEVRAAIDAALPRVERHLAEARRLQSRLGGGAQGGVTLPPPQDTTWLDRAVRRQREAEARRERAADSIRRASGGDTVRP